MIADPKLSRFHPDNKDKYEFLISKQVNGKEFSLVRRFNSKYEDEYYIKFDDIYKPVKTPKDKNVTIVSAFQYLIKALKAAEYLTFSKL
jgi:hypothetical protein